MTPLKLIAASSYARQVDAVSLAWLIFSVFIVVVVFGMLFVFSIRFLNRKEAAQKISHGTQIKAEWTWSILLLVISLSIGIWADWVFFRMHVPPPDATEIQVVAKQWMWKVQHPNGIREINELHVPVGTSIKLVMSSEDIIHSFFIPAFRTKQDVLPGRYTSIWFKAEVPGIYHLFCAEYCGTSHSKMTGKVFAMSPSDYIQWVSSQISSQPSLATTSLASRGLTLFTNLGCISCHESRSPVRAPLLQGLYMNRVGLRTGESVLADENYLRESILNPGAKIVQGYENVMPSFQGQISEEDLLALINYIKSLQSYKRSGL